MRSHQHPPPRHHHHQTRAHGGDATVASLRRGRRTLSGRRTGTGLRDAGPGPGTSGTQDFWDAGLARPTQDHLGDSTRPLVGRNLKGKAEPCQHRPAGAGRFARTGARPGCPAAARTRVASSAARRRRGTGMASTPRRRGGPAKPGAFLRFETPRQKPARRQQRPTQTQTEMITTIWAVFLFFFDESQAVGSGVGAGESHAGAPTAVVSAAPRSTPASLAALSRATSTSSVEMPSDRGRDGRRFVRRLDAHFVGHDDAAGLQPPPPRRRNRWRRRPRPRCRDAAMAATRRSSLSSTYWHVIPSKKSSPLTENARATGAGVCRTRTGRGVGLHEMIGAAVGLPGCTDGAGVGFGRWDGSSRHRRRR